LNNDNNKQKPIPYKFIKTLHQNIKKSNLSSPIKILMGNIDTSGTISSINIMDQNKEYINVKSDGDWYDLTPQYKDVIIPTFPYTPSTSYSSGIPVWFGDSNILGNRTTMSVLYTTKKDLTTSEDYDVTTTLGETNFLNVTKQ
jgi:hypothetical protein